MSSSLPPSLVLDEVIKCLQAYHSGFNLFAHKTIPHRWVLRLKSKNGKKAAYPLTAPKGKNTHIDRSRLGIIAKHFDVPSDVFKKTVREIKNERRQKNKPGN